MVFYSTATPSGTPHSPTLPLMFSLHCVMRKNRGKKQRFKGSDKAGCSYSGFGVYGETGGWEAAVQKITKYCN